MLNSWTELVLAMRKAFDTLGKQYPKMLAVYGTLGGVSAGGALDTKTRELVFVAVATTARCDGCTGIYTGTALKADASGVEVAQTLATAISLDTDAVYVYSLYALEAYDQFKE